MGMGGTGDRTHKSRLLSGSCHGTEGHGGGTAGFQPCRPPIRANAERIRGEDVAAFQVDVPARALECRDGSQGGTGRIRARKVEGHDG